MKHKHFQAKGFQQRLILYNLIIIICIACVISLYNYFSYRKSIIDREISNASAHITLLSDRFSLAYDELVNIVLNCAERKSLFLSVSSNSEGSPQEKKMALYASTVLRDYCAISGYRQYISKLVIYQKQKLFLCAGTSSGSIDDPEDIMQSDWFAPSIAKTSGSYLLSLEDNPFTSKNRDTTKILPLIRPLKYDSSIEAEDSWVFLGISPTLFDYVLSKHNTNQIVYALTESGDIISSVHGEGYDLYPFIPTILSKTEPNGSFKVTIDANDCIIVYRRHLDSGVTLLEVLPLKHIALDKSVIFNTIFFVFLACMLIGIFLSVLISYQLGRPISRLNQHLDRIAKGHFEKDNSIETKDEIGEIGKHVNNMSARISTLLDHRIESEKEKNNLEIKMLQAQINPHFLYNTLDSIKWIATMQKNSGIVQVVAALSSLLKNMAKGCNEKVSLRTELNFLNDYITIEKIRYLELFEVHIEIEDEQIYDAKIIKLTLQPLVENAIFSGIEPSGRDGCIRIRAYAENQKLIITVTDNGIGIPPEQIDSLLSDTSKITKSTMSGIGLPNVDRRIKLVYGDSYGLSITSVVDEYTSIQITMPLEY